MDRNNSFQADAASSIRLIGKEMLRQSVNKSMLRESISKSVNTAELSCVVSEIVKPAGEAGVDMITDLLNQIILQGVITAE